MQTLIDIVKILTSCLPVILLLRAVAKLNLKRMNRAYQFMMPVVAVAYALLLAMFLVWLNKKLQITMTDTGQKVGCITFWLNYSLDSKVQCIRMSLDNYLAKLQQVSSVGTSLGISGAASLADRLKDVLNQVQQTVLPLVSKFAETISKYAMVLINTAMVLGYLVLKAAALPVMRLAWRKESLLESTSAMAYEKDEETKTWMLRSDVKDLRKLMKAIYLAACVVSILLTVLSVQYFHLKPFQVVLFPLLCALVCGEVYFFLCGFTRREYNEEILGEDSTSSRHVNLAKLRETFKSFFGDRLLVEGSEISPPARQSVTDLLNDMSFSAEPRERISAKYFEVLQQEGAALDVDSIRSATRVLYGDNVLFYNPFYRDLTPYLLLPITNTLMNRRKVLIIAGRKSTEPEIQTWIRDALRTHLKMNGMWRVDSIGSEEEFEIGVLPFSQLYDLEMLTAQREFFYETALVLILEPSLVLATGQIGLNLVVNYCEEAGGKTTYCMCDRNCDGLVDSMSHVIKQSILTVAATEAPTSTHTEMCWNGDGEYLQGRVLPDVTRYLGVGTELAVVAAREQATHVSWHSEGKFPVSEMKWIAGQYYDRICRFANLPMSQQSLYDRVAFTPDLWGTEKERYKCMIVEDEFCNLLEMVRTFLTRGTEQAMVNIISENYLLRDYMQHNYRIFAADRKAIPTIVADFANTRRNITFRLLLMLLTNDSVPESAVRKELRLAGLNNQNPRAMLNRLIRHYCDVGPGDYVHSAMENESALDFDYDSENRLFIRRDKQEEIRGKVKGSFYTAYYVMEDDMERSHFMDARLFGHIYQAILPGQFFTYDGKYYEVRSITTENGVVVRRAADHIAGRRYYRQKRRYFLRDLNVGGSTRELGGMSVTTMTGDIRVETESYLEMDSGNGLRNAKEITVPTKPGKPNPYTRAYRHKNVLCIRLPGADETVRYTTCLLLTEIFRTLYADAAPYLAVTTQQTVLTANALRGVLYSMELEQTSENQDCIYILEDSDVDMGLLESVDRNLNRIMGILADFLNWHEEKVNEPEPEEVGAPEEIVIPVVKKPSLWKRIAGWFRRLMRKIGNFFRKLFRRPLKPYPPEELTPEERKARRKAEKEAKAAEKARRKAEREEEKARKKAEREAAKDGKPEEMPAEPAEQPEEPAVVPAEPEIAPEPESEPAAEAAPAEEDVDSMSIEDLVQSYTAPEPTVDVDGEDEKVVAAGEKKAKNSYAASCFLLYGYDEIDEVLALDSLRDYLNSMGFDENELKFARKGASCDAPAPAGDSGSQVCDFCQKPLFGVAYDILTDGRVRCCTCSASAIHTVKEFRVLYRRVLPTMEAFYNIRINVPVRVRTTDAKTIAKQVNSVYRPTSGYDPRTLGFASLDKDGYALYVENGSPRLSTMETISHELTHIWQFRNWDRKAMIKRYGNGTSLDVVYEGMAMWASIQFLYLIGETDHARQVEAHTLARQDAYGEGFRLYCKKYPLSRSSELPARTPFHIDPPL